LNKKKIAPCDYNVKEILRRVFAFLIKNSDILNKKNEIFGKNSIKNKQIY